MAYIFGMSMGNGSWSIYMSKTEGGTGAWANSMAYTVTINGSQVASGSASYDFRSWDYAQTGSITLASGSYSVRSGTNTGSAHYNGGYSNTDASASYTYNPPTPTYTHYIYYNANGGSNAPSTTNAGSTTTQNSFNGTVASGTPTRDGYIFNGWATSSTATTPSYFPSTTYTFNSQSVTLYAVWKAVVYLKDNDVWNSGTLYFKDNGVWKEATAKIKVNNQWQ